MKKHDFSFGSKVMRITGFTMHEGYWGFGVDKVPGALTLKLAKLTVDIFWGYR